jgi:hypothetical protein
VNSDPTLREDGNAADRVGHGWYCARPLIPLVIVVPKLVMVAPGVARESAHPKSRDFRARELPA